MEPLAETINKELFQWKDQAGITWTQIYLSISEVAQLDIWASWQMSLHMTLLLGIPTRKRWTWV